MTGDTPRTRSFGEGHSLTPVDRFGIWLSAREVRRAVPDFTGRTIGDFGCGYHARLVRSLLDRVERAVLVDVSLADDLKADDRVVAIEGPLPEALGKIDDGELDVVMCLSVLEHLWEPEMTLAECRRVAAPGGVCLFNVPTWRGKKALEFSAFRLGLSPAAEMDDHKCYFDPRDLWPLLVRAGFVPHGIRCYTHKFGLNTFAVCRVD